MPRHLIAASTRTGASTKSRFQIRGVFVAFLRGGWIQQSVSPRIDRLSQNENQHPVDF